MAERTRKITVVFTINEQVNTKKHMVDRSLANAIGSIFNNEDFGGKDIDAQMVRHGMTAIVRRALTRELGMGNSKVMLANVQTDDIVVWTDVPE